MELIRKKLSVISNQPYAGGAYKLILQGDYGHLKAGQFVNIAIPGKYLRRPISLHRIWEDEKKIELLYDVVGEGTLELTRIPVGEEIDLLTGLGKGFSLDTPCETPLLLGGGIGCAPLFQLALDLQKVGKKPIVALGYNSIDKVIELNELRDCGIKVFYSTVDGSFGTKGFVTDIIREENIQFDFFYACGPLPMLRALCSLPQSGELSLECRMGCGFGICMCCSLETSKGSRRICKEGPVFRKEELIWK